MVHKLQKSSKKIFFYSIIVLIICLLIFFIFKHISSTSDKKTDNYSQCDQIHNASAPITSSNVLNDKNDIQIIHAQTNGIKQPFATNADFDSLISEMVLTNRLVEVKDCKYYHLKTLKHSHPYLIPEAVNMLDEIAYRFQEKLKEKKLGNYCFFLTSLLRTVETQAKLSHRNTNAVDHSAHYYGTTIDISYKHFYNLDNDSIEPSWEIIQELTKTLIEMRQQCKLLAVRERKQSCFHITVVVCKPKEEYNEKYRETPSNGSDTNFISRPK